MIRSLLRAVVHTCIERVLTADVAIAAGAVHTPVATSLPPVLPYVQSPYTWVVQNARNEAIAALRPFIKVDRLVAVATNIPAQPYLMTAGFARAPLVIRFTTEDRRCEISVARGLPAAVDRVLLAIHKKLMVREPGASWRTLDATLYSPVEGTVLTVDQLVDVVNEVGVAMSVLP